MSDIEIEKLHEYFAYDAETGELTRKVRLANRTKVGEIVGAIHKGHGYLTTRVDGKSYLVHRIAWAMTHGTWPQGEIDHINGIRHDNRICNLRDVSRSLNQLNQHHIRPDNKVGHAGVSRIADGRYRAYININGRRESLGLFQRLGDAIEARCIALRSVWERQSSLPATTQ